MAVPPGVRAPAGFVLQRRWRGAGHRRRCRGGLLTMGRTPRPPAVASQSPGANPPRARRSPFGAATARAVGLGSVASHLRHRPRCLQSQGDGARAGAEVGHARAPRGASSSAQSTRASVSGGDQHGGRHDQHKGCPEGLSRPVRWARARRRPGGCRSGSVPAGLQPRRRGRTAKRGRRGGPAWASQAHLGVDARSRPRPGGLPGRRATHQIADASRATIKPTEGQLLGLARPASQPRSRRPGRRP